MIRRDTLGVELVDSCWQETEDKTAPFRTPEWLSAVLVGLGMCLSACLSQECMHEHACT